MYSVRFIFEQPGLVPVNLAAAAGGQTLLELALQHHIELGHACGGVCSCTTCHLYIEKGMELLEQMERRENDFLTKATHRTALSRLACQSLLLNASGEISVRIPNQSLQDTANN